MEQYSSTVTNTHDSISWLLEEKLIYSLHLDFLVFVLNVLIIL